MVNTNQFIRQVNKLLSQQQYILPAARHYANHSIQYNSLLTQQQINIIQSQLQRYRVDDNTNDNSKSSNDTIHTTDNTSTINTGLLRGASPASTTTSSQSSSTSYSMKPSEMVKQLDRYIIGQSDAKRAVAVACRQRWRRHKLNESLKSDVTPKNILMIGPTGCGKTEIARRLAKLTNAPFIKVEATKYTEVGFHGKDVDSIISDLLRISLQLEKHKYKQRSIELVSASVENKLLDALISKDTDNRTRESFRTVLRSGALDSMEIQLDIPLNNSNNNTSNDSTTNTIAQVIQFTSTSNSSTNKSSKSTSNKKYTIREARQLMEDMELDNIINNDDIMKLAISSVENDGIVFIDEIDKIASSSTSRGADASADGVQRDLLPLIEGTTITTKYGDIKTDHILFIGSGSFHAVKPSDLLAELQGRLPIRVELNGLTENDLYNILTQTEHNIIKQQILLLGVDQVKLTFTDAAIREIAHVAHEANRTIENIGARRLSTVVERIVGEISYLAPDMARGSEILIDVEQVQEKVQDLMKSADLQRYIL